MKKTTQLKKLLMDKQVSVMMEAHNGLTAKLVEEAGFSSIWGSGLSISAALGVRDNNEASWTQVLEVLEFMSDATNIPILLDGDTGYGNFNNLQRLVQKLEQRNIAGVCIEDKLFPKTNSFIGGEQQPLAPVEEFAMKIRAGKDIQTDPDFVIVARTEAFIAGWGLEEALRRANAYADAGADAVLIHSKAKGPEEIFAFLEHWKRETPVIVVPTMYPGVTLQELQERGVSLAIWANQTCRTVVTAVQQTLKTLRESGTLLSLEDKIVPVKELFRLQGMAELKEKEKLYLPATGETTSVVILGATQGKGFGKMTENRPKTMIPIGGKPILAKLVASFNDCGLKQIAAVRGYKKESVNLPNIKYFDNDTYESTEEASSLYAAKSFINGNLVFSFGDILFEKFVLLNLLDSQEDFTIVVDSSWSKHPEKHSRTTDLVIADREHTREYREDNIYVRSIGNEIDKAGAHGEWIGLAMFSARGAGILVETLDELAAAGRLETMPMVGVFAELMKKGHRIKVEYVHGHWLDIDNLDDISDAYNFEERH
ncbi:MAG TPA: phosphoenolpyruvate mutase [Spirochaetota bacterium]|nr:phosphoenolpyruvate mutase [Spirochaetota bacterium]